MSRLSFKALCIEHYAEYTGRSAALCPRSLERTETPARQISRASPLETWDKIKRPPAACARCRKCGYRASGSIAIRRDGSPNWVLAAMRAISPARWKGNTDGPPPRARRQHLLKKHLGHGPRNQRVCQDRLKRVGLCPDLR